MTLSDASAVVPFDYGPGREVIIELVRTGGFNGEVTVSIDDTDLPTGVTLSDTTLTIGAGSSAATVTVSSDDTPGASELNSAVALAMTATASGLTDSATLTFEVAAVVMNSDDDGEGSLRHLDARLPTGLPGDLISVSFDPVVFSAASTIQLASSIDIHHGRHFEGPVNDDGEPFVTVRGADAGSSIIGVKDSVVARFSNLIFENGRDNANGGAIHNAGVLTVDNSIIRESESQRGGGIFNQVNAELTVRDTLVTSNRAEQGGGLFNNGGEVNVHDSTIRANAADSDGGGVYNGVIIVSGTLYQGKLFLADTQVSDNEAVDGGGVANAPDGDLRVVRSIISGNEASGRNLSAGGGIDNKGTTVITHSEIRSNAARFAAGINNPAGSDLSIDSSTFSSNVASSNGGGLFSNSAVVINNSTFFNNEAGRGGALFVSSGPDSKAAVAFSTIAGNRAEDSGGGLYYLGELSLRGSVIADNQVGTGSGPDIVQRPGGTLISVEYNLVGDPTASGVFGPTNLSGDPLLGDLEDNGGETPTMALQSGSTAIDHVPESACVDTAGLQLDRDQRGEARPAGARCDIGAFEVQ